MEKRKYVGTKLDISLQIDEIFTIHYFEYIKNYKGLGEDHNFWEMVYVDCGSIEVTAGEKVFSLQQGEAYFHHPGEYHKIVSDREFSSVFIVSYHTTSPAADFLKSRKFTLGSWEKELIAMILGEAKNVFAGALDIMDQTQLVRSIDAPFGGEQVIRNYVECLLVSIIRNNQNGLQPAKRRPPQQTRGGSERYIVDSVINILTHSLYKKIMLDDICQEVMFSKSYIEKLFRDNMGYGIIKYFNKLKTDEAKRLISEGQHSFTAIAEMLNFGSIHYFSRTFKSFTGMNPSEYAKSVRARGLL